MPKMKTRRSAAKRFTLTGTGKIKRSSAFKRHMLQCKNRKRKNHLQGNLIVENANERQIMRMLAGNGR
jgi:large subunit ribosomal protein L35